MANSINDSIRSIIDVRTAQGPKLIDGYQSSLETAAGQDQQSIDDLRGIYSDPSKFEKSKLGAFASALGASGGSGRFAASLNSALSAANDTNEYNKQQNLSREEKLAKLSSLEAALTRQRANDTMGVYDKQTGWISGAQGDQRVMADINLGNKPSGPRQLGPLEMGPDAPGSSPFEKAMAVINDYYQNPGDYSGPDGQAMVKQAFEMQKSERMAQSRETVAGMRNANKPSISAPEQRRVSGRLKLLDEDAEVARNLKGSIASLKRARDGTTSEGGWGADTWATVGGWMGTEDSGHTQNVRAFATDMKLNLSQKLKGAISNAEQGMLDNATPGLQMTDAAATPVIQAYDLAADRVIERSKFVKAWTRTNGDDYGADEAWDDYVNANPIFTVDDKGQWTVNEGNAKNWQGYVTDVNAEDGVGTQEPGGGQDPNEVIGTDADGNDITIDDILTTARENNMTPEQVIQRLQGGN